MVLCSCNCSWLAAWSDALRCFVWKEDEGLKSEKMQMGKRARKQRAYGDVGRTDNILVLLGSIWAPNHPSVEFTGSIKLGSKKSSATNESIITKHR